MKRKILSAITAVLLSLTLLVAFTACGEKSYAITFLAEDGTQLSTVQVNEGEVPVFDGKTPQKTADEHYTYTFAGWKDADGMVHAELPAATEDATYTAAFTGAVNSYTVKFVLGETTLSEATLEYGSEVSYTGTAPTKAEDAQFTYTFAGWSDGETTYAQGEKFPALSGNVTYTAVFTETRKSYTVTWNVEGQTTTATVPYGDKAVYGGAAPTKAGDEQHTYTFAGWAKTAGGEVLSADQMTVTENVTFYAVFTQSIKTFTVRFLDEGGEELQSGQVEYGTSPVYSGAAPTKAATAQYTYTFAGWLYEGTTYGPQDTLPTATKELTFTATYTSTVNQYTVTWSVNGTTSTTKVEYGQVPTYSGTPEKPDTTANSYEFAGWTAQDGGSVLDTLPAVTGDVTYYAKFNEVAKKYTVTWHIENQTTTSRVTYNTAPTYEGETPEKTPTVDKIFPFTGWSKTAEGKQTVSLSSERILGDTDYYAVFGEAARPYTITFMIDGESHEKQVEYGTKPKYDEDVLKAPSVSTVYTFRAWQDEDEVEHSNDDLPIVDGEATYTAVFDESVRQYTITIKYYKGLDGTETIKADDVFEHLDYGTRITLSNTIGTALTAIDRDGKHYLPDMFYFGGIVTGDKTFTVHYTEADTWDGTTKSDHLEGQGTADLPYLIQSAADLYYLSDVSNNKNYGAGQYYKLTKSIDLANHEWQPICYANGSGTWTFFEGNFDGCGFTIAGLHCDKSTGQGVGLFASVRNGEIKNLTIQGYLSAKSRVGGVAYVVNSETVSNIKAFVDSTLNAVTNEVYSGGLFGTSTAGTSTITNCESYGTFNSTGKRVGGIIGNVAKEAAANITNCTNYGNITIATHAGGIIGQADGKVVLTGCVNYGDMTANIERAGGMIATQSFTGGGTSLTDCVNYGNINTPNAAQDKADATGGIIGTAKSATVTNCTNYGNVNGIHHVGGIIGETVTVTVTGCTNYGNVTTSMESGDHKGYAGIVGWTTTNSNVSDCHNYGDVSGVYNVGGICGYLGKGSTCARDGEEACTNEGTVTAKDTTYGDIVGYDGNLA